MNSTDKYIDKLDVYRHMTQVHSRINSDITSDYIYAKLDEKDKKFILEMYQNAHFCKELGMQIKDKCQTDEERIVVESVVDSLFDSIMKKVHLLVNLSRNTDKNFMVVQLTQPEPEPEDEKIPYKDELKQKLTERRE